MFAPTHELALTETAVAACNRLPSAHTGVLVIKELCGPLGVPDYTALVGSRDALARRLTAGIPPLLNKIDAAIAAVASPAVSRSAVAIAKSLGWPEETVMRRVPRLTRSGAIIEVTKGRYVRAAELGPLGRLYAVEMKVDNYTAAIGQVRSYRVWADNYVLVMARLSERAISSVVKEVEIDRGGLVVDGRWVCRPRIQRLPNPLRIWAAEHFVAGVVGSGYHPSVAP